MENKMKLKNRTRKIFNISRENTIKNRNNQSRSEISPAESPAR